MKLEEVLKIARKLATDAHQEQTDKAGKPYISHGKAVAAQLVLDHTNFDRFQLSKLPILQAFYRLPTCQNHCGGLLDITKEKIVGWLHDIVEDTKITFIDLEKKGIPEYLIEAIKAITKIPREPYEQYIERVKGNKIALSVKIADMSHNCDLSRISNPTAKDYARLAKYQQILPDLIKYQQESE